MNLYLVACLALFPFNLVQLLLMASHGFLVLESVKEVRLVNVLHEAVTLTDGYVFVERGSYAGADLAKDRRFERPA